MSRPQAYKRILVATSSGGYNLDKSISAIALAKILAEVYDTTVDIFIPSIRNSSNLDSLVMPVSVNFLEKLDAEYFTVSIERNLARIKEVKWEETKDKINLHVFTEKGELDTNRYSIIPGKPEYDLVVAFGLNNIDAVKKVLGDFFSIWEATVTMNIDIHPDNQRYADLNFNYPQHQIYGAAVVEHALAENLKVTSQTATELLSAIYWSTNSFKDPTKTTIETFTITQQLLNMGASLKLASSRIFERRALLEMQAEAELRQSIKISAGNIYTGKISVNTAKQLKINQSEYPLKNPLREITDAKISFSLYPLPGQKTLVHCSSSVKEINLYQALSEYKPHGNNYQFSIIVNKIVDQAETELIAIAQKLLPPNFVKSEPAQTTPPPKPIAPSINTPKAQELVDPLAPATEEIKPDPAPVSEAPRPSFGLGGGGGGNPFGPL